MNYAYYPYNTHIELQYDETQYIMKFNTEKKGHNIKFHL